MFKGLQIQNLRSTKDSTLTFKPGVNILLGPNGAGKTTVAAAIEYALTGAVKGITGKRGDGANDLIRGGTREAQITLDIDGIASVTRTITPKGNALEVEGWQGNKTEVQASLMAALETNERILAAVLHATELVDMDPEERAKLILDYAQQDELWLPTIYGKLPERLRPAFDRFQSEPLSDDPTIFEKLYKEFYAVRTGQNKNKKSLETLLQQLKGTADEKAATGIPQLADLKARLEERKKELAAANQQKGAAEQQVKAAQSLKERIERLAVECNNLKSERAWLEDATKEAGFLKTRLQDAESNLRGMETEVQSLKEKRAGMAIEVQRLHELRDRLHDSMGQCPLTKRPCGDSEGLKACESQTEAEHTKAVLEYAAFSEEVNRQAAILELAQQHLSELRNEEKQADTNLAKLDAVKRQLIAASEDLTQTEREFSNLPQITDVEIDGQIAELTDRVNRGQATVQAVENEVKRQKEQAHVEQQLAEQTQICSDLDELVKLFDTDGLPAKLMQEAIAPIQDRMNAVIGTMMPGWSVELTVEDGQLQILCEGGASPYPREARLLSGSEKTRVSILIADVLNQLSGLGIMILDEVDHVVTEEQRAEVYAAIRQIAPSYRFILLIGACMEQIDLAWEKDANLLMWDGSDFRPVAKVKAA